MNILSVLLLTASRRSFFCIVLIALIPTFCVTSQGSLHNGRQELPLCVKKLLRQYTREVTILEIGYKKCPYLDSFMELPGQTIGLYIGGIPQKVLKTALQTRPSRLLLLSPVSNTYDLLFSLGCCEHFDIVIVHDLRLDESAYKPCITAFLRLGDHLFVEAASTEQARICSSFGMTAQGTSQGLCLFYKHKQKTTLEKARFTQPSPSKIPYHIESSFSTKMFSKGPFFQAIPWIHGINMVTFIMLSGIYPSDSMIKKQLVTFEKLYSNHNDLVLGNMIIRGNTLVPIDFEDERRSGKASKCINAALSAFNRGNRLKNPQKWINDYYKSV